MDFFSEVSKNSGMGRSFFEDTPDYITGSTDINVTGASDIGKKGVETVQKMSGMVDDYLNSADSGDVKDAHEPTVSMDQTYNISSGNGITFGSLNVMCCMPPTFNNFVDPSPAWLMDTSKSIEDRMREFDTVRRFEYVGVAYTENYLETGQFLIVAPGEIRLGDSQIADISVANNETLNTEEKGKLSAVLNNQITFQANHTEWYTRVMQYLRVMIAFLNLPDYVNMSNSFRGFSSGVNIDKIFPGQMNISTLFDFKYTVMNADGTTQTGDEASNNTIENTDGDSLAAKEKTTQEESIESNTSSDVFKNIDKENKSINVGATNVMNNQVVNDKVPNQTAISKAETVQVSSYLSGGSSAVNNTIGYGGQSNNTTTGGSATQEPIIPPSTLPSEKENDVNTNPSEVIVEVAPELVANLPTLGIIGFKSYTKGKGLFEKIDNYVNKTNTLEVDKGDVSLALFISGLREFGIFKTINFYVDGNIEPNESLMNAIEDSQVFSNLAGKLRGEGTDMLRELFANNATDNTGNLDSKSALNILWNPVIPKLWKDFKMDLSYSVPLLSQYSGSDPVGNLFHNLKTLAYLGPFIRPRTASVKFLTNENAYFKAPMFLRAFSRGIMNVPEGIVSSMTIERDPQFFTAQGVPTQLKITLVITALRAQELQPSMDIASLTFRANQRTYLSGTFENYLATLCGVNTMNYSRWDHLMEALAGIKQGTYIASNLVTTSIFNYFGDKWATFKLKQ
jgi:hypothetical protein